MNHHLRTAAAQGHCQSGFSPLWEDTCMGEKKRANFVGIINYREVTRRDGGVSAHQEPRSCGVNPLVESRQERQREFEHAGHL